MACTVVGSYAPVVTASEPDDAPSSLPAPQPGAVVTRDWYGWQTLTSDGASVLLVTGALLAKNGFVGLPGLLGFAAGAPIIHAAHGRPWMAVGDAVLRLVTLPLGAFIGAFVGGPACANDVFGLCALDGAFAGAGIGASIPIALDAAVFAYRTHSVDAASRASGLVWQPGVIAVPRGVAAGLSGAF